MINKIKKQNNTKQVFIPINILLTVHSFVII